MHDASRVELLWQDLRCYSFQLGITFAAHHCFASVLALKVFGFYSSCDGVLVVCVLDVGQRRVTHSRCSPASTHQNKISDGRQAMIVVKDQSTELRLYELLTGPITQSWLWSRFVPRLLLTRCCLVGRGAGALMPRWIPQTGIGVAKGAINSLVTLHSRPRTWHSLQAGSLACYSCLAGLTLLSACPDLDHLHQRNSFFGWTVSHPSAIVYPCRLLYRPTAIHRRSL